MKIIDLYQMPALLHTSNIPAINAGMSHFSYTAMSILPYDRKEDSLQEDKKYIIQQRQRYEKYRKENNIPLLDTTDIREEKTNEKQIYHMTGMDPVSSLNDLKKIYKGGVRIFQPRREESNARGESYRSSTGGLNQRGIQAIQRLASQTAIIDCTNAHSISITELLEIYHKPILLRSSSKSLHASIYNYEDELIEQILDQGGLLCIPLDQHNLGDNTINTWMKHIRYAISKRGDKNIAFASGRNATLSTSYIEWASHTQDINHIAEQLTKTFGKKTTEKILRNNAYHFLKKHFAGRKEIN